MKTKVVHCRRKFDVYIGRPSKWGNPFLIGKDGSRQEVIDKYEKYILSRPDLLADLHELRGKTLGCWCKPKLCHGDILARLADSLGVGDLESVYCGHANKTITGVFCMHDGNKGKVCCESLCPLKKETIKKIAQVIFAGNYEMKYDFFTDLELKVDDPVVCHTVRGYSVGKVVGHVETSTKAKDWIVQKVDTDRYKALVERDKAQQEIDDMLG